MKLYHRFCHGSLRWAFSFVVTVNIGVKTLPFNGKERRKSSGLVSILIYIRILSLIDVHSYLLIVLRSTALRVCCVIAAGAGVHCRNELKARRVVNLCIGSADIHVSAFHRFAQYL